MRIKRALNAGRLPKGFSALVEQRIGHHEADVLAIEKSIRPVGVERMADSGIATMTPPSTRIIRPSTKKIYAGRANLHRGAASSRQDRRHHGNRFAGQ